MGPWRSSTVNFVNQNELEKASVQLMVFPSFFKLTKRLLLLVKKATNREL